MIRSVKTILQSKKGQTLIELTLIFPLMLALLYGAIEVGSVISTYLTLTSTTREGANLTSRGTNPNTALGAIITAAAPTIRSNNQTQWKVIYSKIVQDPNQPCPQAPCKYIVDTGPNGRVTQGSLNQSSKFGPVGTQVNTNVIAGIDNVNPGQIFHAIEVYYDYTPNVMTYVGSSLINKTFYERTIFTNVSSTS